MAERLEWTERRRTLPETRWCRRRHLINRLRLCRCLRCLVRRQLCGRQVLNLLSLSAAPPWRLQGLLLANHGARMLIKKNTIWLGYVCRPLARGATRLRSTCITCQMSSVRLLAITVDFQLCGSIEKCLLAIQPAAKLTPFG